MLRFSRIEPTTGAEETICGCLRPWRGGISVTAAQEEKFKFMKRGGKENMHSVQVQKVWR
jgi:hypothetical protein